MKIKKFLCIFMTVVVAAVSFVVPAGAANVKPDAPSNVSAAVKSETSVKLSWDAVKNADSYIVYYSTEKKEGFESYGQTTKTSATVKGLTAGTKYYFRVKAVQKIDGKKVKSDYSKAATAVPKVKETNTSNNTDFNSIDKKALEKNWDNYKGKFKYWMNPKSKKFHCNDCRTLKHYENFIGTNERSTAINEGYVPCKVCYP